MFLCFIRCKKIKRYVLAAIQNTFCQQFIYIKTRNTVEDYEIDYSLRGYGFSYQINKKGNALFLEITQF